METINKTPNSVYKIRFNDCDLLGHLNNARYLDYFMNAREDHLKEYYNLSLVEYYQKGIAWVVTGHEIVYLRSAVYDETVTIQTSLLLAEPNELCVELIMMNESKTHLKAIMRTQFVPINSKTGKRESHSSEFMKWAKSIENTATDKQKSLQDRINELRPILKEREVA